MVKNDEFTFLKVKNIIDSNTTILSWLRVFFNITHIFIDH